MIDTLELGKLQWMHVQHPTDGDLNKLQQQYVFHPLDIEDCKIYTQRPKVDVYEDYYFIILHFPHLDNLKHFVKTKEVKIFWGKNYIITVGRSH